MKSHRTIRYKLHPLTHEKHKRSHGIAGAFHHVWNHFVGKFGNEYKYHREVGFRHYTLCPQFTLDILAAGNTATRRIDGDISWSIKRQKVASKAGSLSVHMFTIPLNPLNKEEVS